MMDCIVMLFIDAKQSTWRAALRIMERVLFASDLI